MQSNEAPKKKGAPAWRVALCGAIAVASLVYYHERTKYLDVQPLGAKTPLTIPSNGVADAPDAAPAFHVRAATRDVTFLAVSDTHLGYVPEDVEAHLVRELDAIEGKSAPKAIGGTVGHPRGVLITGDLTEWGTADEFARYLHFFGSTATAPSEAGLTIPAYEVPGNHDDGHGPQIAEEVGKRHGGRPYSFDFDDAHFVALGEAPDDVALDWLERDLSHYANDVPLVVYFHLALAGPWSRDNWFDTGDYKSRLAKILTGRCVVGIVHGHHHATDHYEWKGFDVYKPGAVKHDAHTFAVFHLTADRATVGYWNWESDAWVWSQNKALCGPSP